MAQARQARGSSSGEEARIGGGTRVRGRVTGEGSLTIEGTVEGDIQLRGDLTITDGGAATSDVQAENVTIGGNLEGDIEASGHVRLGPSARVRGNLRGAAFVIEDGAQFSGRIDCEFDMPGELGEKAARR